MIILVTGSRNFDDGSLMENALLNIAQGHVDVEVIHGGARGADTLAQKIADFHGWTCTAFPAEWNVYGKAAGHIRNQKMVNYGPDVAIAFPVGTSRGTRDCVRRARKGGIPVVVVGEEGGFLPL